eukprot:scaffold16844_cov119-Isochrysis_galbana.AAC.6
MVVGVYEYELSGGWWGPVGPIAIAIGPTSPVCARKIPHAPERGVGRPPRADPPPSKHEVEAPFPAPLCLPCLVAMCMCMGSVLAFVLRELDPPLPPRKGDHRVGAQKPTTTCKKQMTDPPTDDTEAREPDSARRSRPDRRRTPAHTHLATATPEACFPTRRHSPRIE